MLGYQLCPYPGCKAKLRAEILPVLLSLAEGVDEFVDVFAGAGGIALPMMFRCPDIVHRVNDRDSTMVSLWLSVRDHPGELVGRVNGFIPNRADFDQFRRKLRDAASEPPDQPDELLDLGFCRLAYQSMVFSGWADGGARTKIDARWCPRWRSSLIRLNSWRMHFPRELRITNEDFVPLIADASRRALLFCDPPYILDLVESRYPYGFSPADHARLAEMLKLSPHQWVLTYGDHPRIRRLYEWAWIERLGKNELLITRR